MTRLIAPLFVLLMSLLGPVALADTAQQVVEGTAQQMLATLKANRDALRQDPKRIYPLVERIAVPRFDFETIARWVLGKNWRAASPEQQGRFTAEFRALLVRTYGNALLQYSDETIRFLPAGPPSADNEVLVRSEFQPRSGPAVPINYSVHQKGGQWLVYDVSVDGISLVANYRSTFAERFRQGGMDAVIGSITELNSRGATK